MPDMNMHYRRIRPRPYIICSLLVITALAGCQPLPSQDRWLAWPWQQEAEPEKDPAAAHQRMEVEHLLEQGNRAFTQDKLSVPQQGSAVFYYRKALALDPGNNKAKAGIENVVKRYHNLARTAHDNGNGSQARKYLQRATEISGPTKENEKLRKTLQQTPQGANPRNLIREPETNSARAARVKAATRDARIP